MKGAAPSAAGQKRRQETAALQKMVTDRLTMEGAAPSAAGQKRRQENAALQKMVN